MTGYVELHCHSAYSFLDGASSPAELAETAAELDYPALALTDHDGLWGSMEMAQACKGPGIRPVTGAEVTVTFPSPGPERGVGHLTLLVEDRNGYANLCRLLTEAHARTREGPGREPGRPAIAIERLAERSQGLVCLSGCAREGVLAGRWAAGESECGEDLARTLAEAFGSEGLRIELQRPYWRGDRARNRWLEAIARRLGIPTVATGNVHMHRRSRGRLQDALVAVREGVSLDASEVARRGNSSGALARPEAMAERFADHPDAIAETVALAERLRFDLTSDLGYRYPGAEDAEADLQLARICHAALADRYPDPGPARQAAARLDEELALVRHLGLSGFFLLHRDLLELARELALEVRGPGSVRSHMPPGRGRGSSVSSLICYLTGLSHIDPIHAGLRPGRFLNPEISEPPDIDLDFPRDLREKLIPRIHERYGPDRSALVAAFPTYRSRGAIRDFGKALGLPYGEIERVARAIGPYDGDADVERAIAAQLGPDRLEGGGRWAHMVDLCSQARGLPRHASQHSGGMILSTRPLTDMCPVVPAAMEGRQIAQWDKDSCADAGFLKIDLLGLGMLSAVERCLEEIERSRGEAIDLTRIPLDDEDTFESIRRGDTTGTFQIESRAQMQMLVRTQPRTIEDLTIQVALVRPGPIQGGAVHPYIERHRRLREDPGFEIPYEHPLLEPVLAETLGAIIYQDQVIEVAQALAGFSVGEGESLRRAMSRKRSQDALRRHHRKFVEGALGRGVARETAERVFAQILGFSGYGFPKSHSAAFGLLAYQSAWLREHFGPEYLSALLNEQPMGFYPPDSLVHEAQRRGIVVAGADVNASRLLCYVQREESGCSGELAVRIGLGYVGGLARESAERIVAERERQGPYRDLADLAGRSGVSRVDLERLAWAGALSGLSRAGARRDSLWRLGIHASARWAPSGTQLALPIQVEGIPELPDQSAWEQLLADYETTAMTISSHPMHHLRPDLPESIATSEDLARLRDGDSVQVAGLVIARQRPETARGIVFVLLEDELGTINLVIPPPVTSRHRTLVHTAPALQASGELQLREGTVNVLVEKLTRIGPPDLSASAPPVQAFGRRGR